MEKELKSHLRLIWIISIILAILFVIVGVCMGIDPAERQRGESFFLTLIEHPEIPYLWRIIFIIAGFLNISFMLGLSFYLKSKTDKWIAILQWITIIGIVSSILHSIDWMREIGLINYYRNMHAKEGIEGLRMAIKYAGVLANVDHEFIWRFGGFGVYVLFTSIIALKDKLLPKGATIFGILAGVCLILTMIFGITDVKITIGNFQMAAMPIPSALGGSIFGPIWLICTGFALKKELKESKIS